MPPTSWYQHSVLALTSLYSHIPHSTDNGTTFLDQNRVWLFCPITQQCRTGTAFFPQMSTQTANKKNGAIQIKISNRKKAIPVLNINVHTRKAGTGTAQC
jgi:hypothetical protein